MGLRWASRPLSVALVLAVVVVVVLAGRCDGGVTSSFVRRTGKSVDMPLDSDVFRVPRGYNAPQQVHITQGDHNGAAVTVSWVTQDEPGSSTVLYGTTKNKIEFFAEGKYTRYKFYNYTSGNIHHCTLRNLKHGTKYYYALGFGHTLRQFWFRTPPKVGPDVPYTFGLIGSKRNILINKFMLVDTTDMLRILFDVTDAIDLPCVPALQIESMKVASGDLGQTFDSNSTLSHYESNPKAQTVLYVGDLSYADNYPNHDNVRWDTWGRFVERSVAYQPWIWTAGNHEIDFAPEIGENEPFKPFRHRYHVPYKASGSTSPFWYSIKRASAFIIVLSSYSAYGKYTPQYKWLEQQLPKVNRSETPWLIVLVHSPWYNSYNYHYMEGETMRVMFEPWLVQHKVDVVFSGHVHAYERSYRISNVAYNIVNRKCTPVPDQSAPAYITVGDGGNIEGLANNMTEPQPGYSAYREASFGHAIFDIKNRTHAYFNWHRNQDGNAVAADSMLFYNRYWHSIHDSVA